MTARLVGWTLLFFIITVFVSVAILCCAAFILCCLALFAITFLGCLAFFVITFVGCLPALMITAVVYAMPSLAQLERSHNEMIQRIAYRYFVALHVQEMKNGNSQ